MLARGEERGREVPAVSLVLPTYNPGNGLDHTCRAVDEFVRRIGHDWEFVFVCDGCSDGSEERLRSWAERHAGQVRVLGHRPNRGKGFAVRRGLAEAQGRWRLFTDVDLAYGFDDVVRVLECLRQGADVAIASRLHAESRLTLPPNLLGYAYRRSVQSQVFSWLVRGILPLRQRDTQAGLKGMTAAAAHAILPLLHCNGFGFDCELLTACERLALHVAEVPVAVRYEDAQSTTGARSMLRMLRELWAIRRSWPRGAVPMVPSMQNGDRPSNDSPLSRAG
jgi:dolichyl-phosphate beta-glucosyltransferase